MKLAENTPLNSKWMEEREYAVETALFLYNTITHRFKVDERYGEEFVKNNQELIGLLVNAAVNDLEKCREK